MAECCSCLQCRLQRECYGDPSSRVDPCTIAAAIAAMVPVLAEQLSNCSEETMQGALAAIVAIRARILAGTEDGTRGDLAGMVAVGRG